MNNFFALTHPFEQLAVVFVVMAIVYLIRAARRVRVRSARLRQMQAGEISRLTYERSLYEASGGAWRRGLAYLFVAILMTALILRGGFNHGFLFTF